MKWLILLLYECGAICHDRNISRDNGTDSLGDKRDACDLILHSAFFKSLFMELIVTFLCLDNAQEAPHAKKSSPT